jgi:sporulation protein YlmC with PRC-barrel domain
MKTIVTGLALLSLVTLPFAGDALAAGQPKQPGYQSGAGAQPGAQAIRPVQDPDTMGYWRGSAIIGQNVRDAEGKNIGKIEDLMVDSNGRVSFAILSFGGFLGIGDKLYAVPWTAMRFDRDGRDVKAVILDVTKERLERAPSFARDRWPDGDRQWGEESRRYWGDAAITSKVKLKLAAEKASTLAKIDVDTRQGVVQLSGTVENERMKQRAAELAREVNGVRRVVNTLKVQAGG